MATGLHDRLGIGTLKVVPTGDQQRLERVDLAPDRRERDDGVLTSWLIGAAHVGSNELTKTDARRRRPAEFALGIESWRNLSKDTFLGFLERLPEVDPEVALKLIDQVPEITALARGTVEDATKAYDTALKANAHGQDAVDQIHRQRLEILQAELEKDLTPGQWTRVLDDMREINVNALLKDTENKKFISDQFHATLATVGAAVVAVGAVVFAAIKSGEKPGGFLKS